MAADRDASVRVDITVGNGAADTCAGGGTANAITVIPVMTQTWLADDFTCPDSDGVFDGADTDILLISQNLDFTTDTSTSSWSDIDGDGCSVAGAGPAAGFTRTGVCIDLGAQTVTTVATGTIGSDGSPLFDLTFATRLPNTLSVAFPGCDGEALLVALDLEGVCCSLGSTCASGSAEPAPILLAMQSPPDVYRSTLRFSVGRDNTEDEIDEAIQRTSSIVTRLRSRGN